MDEISNEQMIAEIARLAQISESQVMRFALGETLNLLFCQQALKFKDATSKEDWTHDGE